MVGMIVSEAIVNLFASESIAPKAFVYSQMVGNGSALDFTVTHNFNSPKVIVQVHETDGFEIVLAEVEIVNDNSVKVKFAQAPTTNQYTVIVIGG
jgi:hypothetical protein